MNGGGGRSAGGGGGGRPAQAKGGTQGAANQRRKRSHKATRNNRTIGLYQSSGTRVGGGRGGRRSKPVSPAKSRNIG